ncbi:MAG: right-handed parallel beta-helix repeat-containing protein, partial [candidate division Zixibacteria bacterium]|nr:right-handed parallel beta-helix repeat-containing protein [candidate division Zixibacteria bacterium]
MSVAGETITVPTDEPTIQAGVNLAESGDTVLILPGTYTGTGNKNIVVNSKSIVITSRGSPESVVIDCGGTYNRWFRGFEFRNVDSRAILEGVSIQGGYIPRKGGAILCDSSTLIVRNCILSGNTLTITTTQDSELGGAIYCGPTSFLTVSSCVLAENNADYGSAICVEDATALIENCTLYKNDIYMISASVTLDRCLVAYNRSLGHTAVYWRDSECSASFSCCNLYGNSGGDWEDSLALYKGINGNISANPMFCNPGIGDFSLLNTSLCAPSNNDYNELIGAVGVGCYATGRVIRIAPDGAGDAPSIQAAIDLATHGDTIWLASGTYTGVGNRDIDTRGKLVTILSGGRPEATVIDCQGGPGEAHRGFRIENAEDSCLKISGLTITRGYATTGGGIYMLGVAPIIENCIFRENTSYLNNPSNGGGAVLAGNSSPVFVGCTFNNNRVVSGSGGALGFRGACDPRLVECVIENNQSERFYGGGVYFISYNPSHSLMIVDCVLRGNSAWKGGGLYANGTVSLVDCVLARNEATRGASAATVWWSSSEILGCTIVGNQYLGDDPDGGSAVFLSEAASGTPVENCIISNNEVGLPIDCAETPSVACCDIYGNSGGDWVGALETLADSNGNFSADPLFCDASAMEYQIGEDSPCTPSHNSCGELVGALSVGCASTGVGDKSTESELPEAHAL